MQLDTVQSTAIFVFLFLPYAAAIDCYECTSLAGEVKDCEDSFRKDLTTEPYITRKCYYGFFRAHFCVKLKGIREDGTSILVRQCAFKDWGNHCGEIKYDRGDRIENIDGCLVTCDFDGCNSATTVFANLALVTMLLLAYFFCS